MLMDWRWKKEVLKTTQVKEVQDHDHCTTHIFLISLSRIWDFGKKMWSWTGCSCLQFLCWVSIHRSWVGTRPSISLSKHEKHQFERERKRDARTHTLAWVIRKLWRHFDDFMHQEVRQFVSIIISIQNSREEKTSS